MSDSHHLYIHLVEDIGRCMNSENSERKRSERKSTKADGYETDTVVRTATVFLFLVGL